MHFTNYLLAGAALVSTAFSVCIDYHLIQYLAEHPDLPDVALSMWLTIDGVECSRLIKHDETNTDQEWYLINCDKKDYFGALSTNMEAIRWSGVIDGTYVLDQAEIDTSCADVGGIPFICDSRGKIGC